MRADSVIHLVRGSTWNRKVRSNLFDRWTVSVNPEPKKIRKILPFNCSQINILWIREDCFLLFRFIQKDKLPRPAHVNGALQKWKQFIPVKCCVANVKQKSRSILLPSVVIEEHHRNARIHQITYLSTFRVCLLQSPSSRIWYNVSTKI